MPLTTSSTSSSVAAAYPFNVTNLTPQNMVHWRKALGRVRSGGGNARIVCIGDSTTFGVGSSGSTATTGQNYPPLSYPAQLSGLFNAAGVNATWQSWVGDQSTAQKTVNGCDSRVTAGSGWADSSTGIGGAFISNSTASSGALSFKPTINVDTFRILYYQGGGSFTYNIDGGSNTTVSVGSSAVIGSTTVSAGSLGSHTLNINQASGQIYINGSEAWNSAISQVVIDNAGWSGATSSNISGAAVGPAAAASWTGFAPDLVILNIGINDWDASVTAASYTTNLQAIITAIKSYGGADIVLMTPTPTNTANGTLVNQQNLITAMYALAASNNIPLIDVWARWQSYAVSQPLGLYADTFTHPAALGYADQAQLLRTVLLGV